MDRSNELNENKYSVNGEASLSALRWHLENILSFKEGRLKDVFKKETSISDEKLKRFLDGEVLLEDDAYTVHDFCQKYMPASSLYLMKMAEAKSYYIEVLSDSKRKQDHNDIDLIEINVIALENLSALMKILNDKDSVNTLSKYEITEEMISLNERFEEESQLYILKRIVALEKKIIQLIGI